MSELEELKKKVEELEKKEKDNEFVETGFRIGCVTLILVAMLIIAILWANSLPEV